MKDMVRATMRKEQEWLQEIMSQPLNFTTEEATGLLEALMRSVQPTTPKLTGVMVHPDGVEIPQVDRLIRLILKYRLYQNGWVLRDDIRDHFVLGGVIIGGAIKWVDGVAVGVVVIVDSLRRAGCYRIAQPNKKQLHVFVRKAHRRKGIASELINTVRDQITPGTYAEIGIDGSEYFWSKMKVTVN